MNNALSRFLHRLPYVFGTALVSVFIACGSEGTDSQDNGGGSSGSSPSSKGSFFIGVKSSAASGEEYVIQATSLEQSDLNIKDNLKELVQTDYTWIFRKDIAVGFAYGYAQAGYGYAMRLVSEDQPLQSLNDFRIEPRYTNYGFFNNQLITLVGGLTKNERNDGAAFTIFEVSANGVKRIDQKILWTEDYTHNGQQITFAGVSDNGDGTFLTSAIQSDFHQATVNDGSSIGFIKYPDSVWVAKIDKDMNLVKLYGDDRLSFSGGRFRSQVFTQILRTNGDTTYVFSSGIAPNTTRPAGALRIINQPEGFDKQYFWNIQQAAGGYKFRRVWHLADDKYLLEIYDEPNPTNISPAHQFAIADMSDQKLTWIKGLPAKNQIKSGGETGGVPLFHNGKIYLPITQYGEDAAIYIIPLNTAIATKGITVKGASEIRSIGFLSTK